MSKKLLFLLLTVLFAHFSTPARAEMSDYPMILLQSLDKVTARTMTFEARVGSTIKYGPLYIKIQSCRKAPPIEPPESAAFLQIWEITPDDEAAWIFSGWMFASSPALSSMDHPIYDVWVLECKGDAIEEEEFEEAFEEENAESTTSSSDLAAMPDENDEYNNASLQNSQDSQESQDSSITPEQPAIKTFEQMNTDHNYGRPDIEIENLMEEE